MKYILQALHQTSILFLKAANPIIHNFLLCSLTKANIEFELCPLEIKTLQQVKPYTIYSKPRVEHLLFF